MGTKPARILAGLALAGLLASGCQRNSTLGGLQGSANFNAAGTGFNGAVAGRSANGSLSASTQAGTPAGTTQGAVQLNGAGYAASVSTGMPPANQQTSVSMQPLNQLHVPPVTMSGVSNQVPVTSQTMSVPSGSVAPVSTNAGPMTYGSSTMPTGRSVEGPAATGGMSGQAPLSGMPSVPMTPPPPPLAPGGSMMPNQ